MSKQRRAGSLAKAMSETRRPIGPDGLPLAKRPMPAADEWGGDNMVNFLSGLGTSRDKRSSNQYNVCAPKTLFELENAYADSWLASRIVNTPADDMTREWIGFTWEGQDDDENGVEELREAETAFQVRAKFTSGLRWARLFGGSVGVIGIKGQADTSQALDLNTVKKGSLDYLHIFDRWRIAPSGMRTTDLSSPNFGLPETYVIAESGTTVPYVHWTRVVRFNGRPLPYFLWQRNGMWDESELAHILSNIKDYDATKAGIASMVFEASVDIIKSQGLATLLATTDGETKVQKRYLLAAMMKSYNRTLMLDKEKEEYQQKTITFSGTNEVLMRLMIDICGAADIPTTRLFGQSPAGMTATGESDTRNYYDHIASKQETQLRPQLERFYQVLCRSTFGAMPKNFKIDFNPLWQTSDKERADIDYTRAQTDQIYLVQKTVTEELVARELMERRTYRTMEQEDVDLIEQQAEQAKQDEADRADAAAEAFASGGPDQPGGAPGAPGDPNVTPPGGLGEEQQALTVVKKPTGIGDSRVGDMVRKDANGWNVYSQNGSKHLGGPYKSKGEALKRLAQVEAFKNRE